MTRLDGLQILARYRDISYADLHNRIRGVLPWIHEFKNTATGWKHIATYSSADVQETVQQIRAEREV